MTEQVGRRGVVSNRVDIEGHEIVSKTVTVPSKPVNVIWQQTSGHVSLIGQQKKTLTERFNEAYDEDARREDEEFFRATRAYYRRRSNNEN